MSQSLTVLGTLGEKFNIQSMVFPSVGLGDPPIMTLSPSIKALSAPQKFSENNGENSSLLLKIPPLVNLLGKTLQSLGI